MPSLLHKMGTLKTRHGGKKGNEMPKELKRAKNILCGGFAEGDGEMRVVNPATGELLGVAPSEFSSERWSPENIGEIARAAQEFWHWEVEEQEKEAVFAAMAQNFKAHRGPLARTMVLEGGKLGRWADAEVQEVLDTITHYHGEVSRYHTNDGFARCQLPDKNAFSLLMPYGNILTVKPWNFPAAVPMWAICGALAGGNSVLVKPAEQTPFTMQYVAELVLKSFTDALPPAKAGRLAGLVQVVNGTGPGTGKPLLEKYAYDKVTFTGSDAVGRIIARTAGERLKPCHLELGGHAAMVVLDDFDIDLAVREALNAVFGDSGQRCVSTRVVYVQESAYKEFLSKFVAGAKTRRVGNPMDPATDMGPLISLDQREIVNKMVLDTASQLGRKPLVGGYALNYASRSFAKNDGLNVDDAVFEGGGAYFAPTIFTEVPYGTTAMDQEIFGPVVVVNPLAGRTREEAFWNAVALVNKSQYGLSNALLTNDRRISSRAPGRIHTGIFYIGRGTTGAELNKYFGGVKSSGWGREGRGLGDWTQIQQVYDDFHGKARMAQAGADDTVRALLAASRSVFEK